jgi:hypothetical protein
MSSRKVAQQRLVIGEQDRIVSVTGLSLRWGSRIVAGFRHSIQYGQRRRHAWPPLRRYWH